MAIHLNRSLFAVISLTLFLLSLPSPSHAVPTEFLSVPSSVFSTAVKTAIDQVGQTLSLLSQFASNFGDSRLSHAVDDCVDLLDFSNDELTWTLSDADGGSNGKGNGTGNSAADLKTWLSAALGNQDTCLDGFDGTDGNVKSLVAGSLQTLTGTVSELLGMVRQGPSRGSSGGPPPWIKPGERRLLQAPLSGVTPDVTVAADGSGDFTSVKDAVIAAPDYNMRRYVIYIKRGVYRENVEIKKKKWNLMMVGDGMGITVISSNRNFVDGWTTFRSATFAVSGRGFIARDMTFENTAGPEKHQAVALRSDSDLSAFYRCGIHGYQDTLYAHSLRQFYRECSITGTVDFIFGNGAVVFQNCLIRARKPLPNQKNTITAQGRKDPNQNTGFSIQYCNVSADADLLTSQNSTLTYLGRPWKEYSRTVFMQSYFGGVIRPEGWLEWNGDFALNTLYYGEYMNFGPGSSLGSRVKWPGFHQMNESTQASNYTVSQFIDGNLWLPATGVRYTSGLMV
ncbi:pectinesterase/pectinesterase inhibitor PPE8B-like [Magnolia sinica]|uniref:pectinesterase/pectinesterase inhibitor PPE8B-like n=1 Tax=Magnolia sinica TaxID=86752 RepID=UPI00265A56CB|nr:pectinesterase/pectinesterase inhibitor PPE8B-like [Magnolia sinica]